MQDVRCMCVLNIIIRHHIDILLVHILKQYWLNFSRQNKKLPNYDFDYRNKHALLSVRHDDIYAILNCRMILTVGH